HGYAESRRSTGGVHGFRFFERVGAEESIIVLVKQESEIAFYAGGQTGFFVVGISDHQVCYGRAGDNRKLFFLHNVAVLPGINGKGIAVRSVDVTALGELAIIVYQRIMIGNFHVRWAYEIIIVYPHQLMTI